MAFLSSRRLRVNLEELPDDFEEAIYLHLHEDVAEAVRSGRMKSGAVHWLMHGKMEGRRYRQRRGSPAGSLARSLARSPAHPSARDPGEVIECQCHRPSARGIRKQSRPPVALPFIIKWMGRMLFAAYHRRPNGVSRHFHHVLELAAAESKNLPKAISKPQDLPLISFIVPVYNAEVKYLEDLFRSFERQPRELCEFIFSDDGSTSLHTLRWLRAHEGWPGVKVLYSVRNQGIALTTNKGIAGAIGRWIAFVDHDDLLAPFAVLQIAKALHQAPHCQFLYTDELVVDRHLHPRDYFLKPAWDPVLLSGVNYVNHLALYRRGRLLEMGGLRDGFQGSQDYDLLLRYTMDLAPTEILHLPFPAYLWRRHRNSFSQVNLAEATLNARRALAEAYSPMARSLTIEDALAPDLHRLRFDSACSHWPLVSVVIPSRDALPLISTVLEGLSKHTDYPALEIIVIDNGSKDPDVLALYERYRRGKWPFLIDVEEAEFNFSRSVNRGIARARGDILLLLNNDVAILEPSWLKEMVSCLEYPETGIVGAKLLYPDGRIQHAGVIAGLGGVAGHWFVGCHENFLGPMARLGVRQSLSVVTGACMLITRSCIERTGRFDEAVFGIAYNDVDFCLRANAQGMRVVWTPFAVLSHWESATRGPDDVPARRERFRKDKENLMMRHHTDQYEDRAFNPWYSKSHSNPVPAYRTCLPSAR